MTPTFHSLSHLTNDLPRRVVCGVLCLCCLIFMACDDEVLSDYYAQPTFALNDSTSFSVGTVLLGETSSTRKLMLYNRNDGILELSRIALRGGDSSIFHLNVDGMAGSTFDNADFLRIAKNDSLCLLLEASYQGEQTTPTAVHEDWIDITCNGQESAIRLILTTWQVEKLRKVTIAHDTTWLQGGVDKHLFDTLTIAPDATLTIEPAYTLYLHDHAAIEVYGSLRVEGQREAPVVLQGDRLDSLFSNLAYKDMSAQWDGIHYHPTSHDNLLQYAEVRGMTSGLTLCQERTATAFLIDAPEGLYVADDPKRYAYGPDFLTDENQQLIIRHSLLINADSALITARNANMIVENSCLMNSPRGLLCLAGGAYDITHCTLANYNYWAAFKARDIVLRNYDTEADGRTLLCPLYRCNFTNTLVYGRSKADPNVDLDYLTITDSEGQKNDSVFSYRFDHCLLHASTGSDDEDFLSTLWTDDPLYLTVDMDNYYCDPHVQAESPCCGAGEARTVSRLPLDRDGKTRPTPPAIGCYEP